MIEKILSVGIDIGTSTTQLVFSEIEIEDIASAISIPQVKIVDKKIIYKSDIIITPFQGELIDTETIQKFVDNQYTKAGVSRESVDTGAVIITGETVRKENSRLVSDVISGYAGDFVVATAGPDLESIIAGKGVGAFTFSKKYHAKVVNFDIGGGTTNLAVFDNGETIDTACFDIGGRLIKVNENQQVTYINEKIQYIINEERINLKQGEKLVISELNKIIKIMVQVLENSLGLGKESPYYKLLITNKALKHFEDIEYITFSGGVADFLLPPKEDSKLKYNDIGILLGEEIYKSSLLTVFERLESEQTIRATVVGAGSHTTEISGSTVTYSDSVLPLKNIPVIKISNDQFSILKHGELEKLIKQRIEWYKDEAEEVQNIALSFEGFEKVTFLDVQEFADEIINGLSELISLNKPIIVIVERDMAKVLGQTIQAKIQNKIPVVCIDSISVGNGDYIDIGVPVKTGGILPVVIKTLIFS